LTCGNLKFYVPKVSALIKAKDEQRYLLLQSLREVISRHAHGQAAATFKSYVSDLTPILLEHAENKEDAVRGMVAECLGRMIVIDHSGLLAQIEKLYSSTSAFTRALAVTALRFTLAGGPEVLAALKSQLSKFIPLLKDTDLNVKRQAVLTISSIANSNVELLAEVLKKDILPVLYKETVVNKSLITQINYGWMTVPQDDGLPLRKATYQCLETLLDVAPHRLDMKEFITEIQKGISDTEVDIIVLTFGLFHTIGSWHGSALLQIVDSMVPSLLTCITSKLKEKEKEPEKTLAVMRAAVRALVSMNVSFRSSSSCSCASFSFLLFLLSPLVLPFLQSVTGTEQCPKFKDFYGRVLQTPYLTKILNEMSEGGSSTPSESKSDA
jgi:cullin-associated NEDD8-dissociated protein 1